MTLLSHPTPPRPTPAYRMWICATVTSPLAKTCCFQHYIFLQHLGVQTRYIWYIRRSQSEPHRCQAGLEVSGGCRWNSSRTGWWNMGTGPVSFVGKALEVDEVDIQFWEFGLNCNILQLYQNSTTNLFKKNIGDFTCPDSISHSVHENMGNFRYAMVPAWWCHHDFTRKKYGSSMFQQEKCVVTPSLRSKDAQRLALPGGFVFFF